MASEGRCEAKIGQQKWGSRSDHVHQPTGVNGGETMVGIGSRVETAGTLVSPLMSEPKPLDFRLDRGML